MSIRKNTNETTKKNITPTTKRKDSGSFLVRLRSVLDLAEKDGLSHVVSWQPHGRAFKIHNRKLFCSQLLPTCMDSERYGAFQRVLRRWGFFLMKNGKDEGAYFHRLFVRSDPSLCRGWTPQQMRDAMPDTVKEPNFYAGEQVEDDDSALKLSHKKRDREELNKADLQDDQEARKILPASSSPGTGVENQGGCRASTTPTNPPAPYFLVNYIHDREHVPGLMFPWKLHQMLDDAESDPEIRENVVSWQPDGVSFTIRDKDELVAKVLRRYFQESTWDEFMKNLSAWGFVKFTSGPQKGAYIHRLLIRGKRGLCKQMRVNGKTVRLDEAPLKKA